ncbi:ABC transporter substrate-binding protein [soil metagenome]
MSQAKSHLKSLWLAGAAALMLFAGPALAFQEAPQLADQVKAGKLPAVDQRLPEKPLVVKSASIGKFGGTLSMHILGGTDRGNGWLQREIGYERLVRWAADGSGWIPNIAESIDVSPDGTKFTFHLRKGMKWSDGKPLTSDDYEFWWNEVALNKEISPSGPVGALVQNREPATFTKIDPQTFSYAFKKPYGLFLQQLAAGFTGMEISAPAHYAKQFHKKFNPDGVDALVKAAGAKSWVELFYTNVGSGDLINNNATWTNPELPVLNPWVVQTPYNGSSSEVLAVRNPYFFKVDPDGNQLPYTDSVRIPIYNNAEVFKLAALKGQIDFVYEPQSLGVSDKPVFFDNQKTGKFHFVGQSPDISAAQVLHLNLEVTDPVKKQIFNQKDFRIALSLAINRKEIIDILYAGIGEPWNLAPRKESPYFDMDMAKRWTEYDPKKANALLDGLGYTKRDADGFRLGPDGKRISVFMDVRTTTPLQSDGLELMIPKWKDIGIELKINSIDSALYQQRQLNNTFEAASNTGAGGLMEILNPRLYVPINTNAIYGIPWSYWYTKDPKGIEPPAIVKKQFELYDEFLATADPKKQHELFAEILRIAKEEFRVIGINLLEGTYALATDRMGNIPDKMIDSAVYPTPAPLNTFTWYIKQ